MNNDSFSSTQNFRETLVSEEISRRAYELWEQEGRPEGRELDHWLQSEREFREKTGSGRRAAFSGSDYLGDRTIAADSPPPSSAPNPSRRGAETGQRSATPFGTGKRTVSETSRTRGDAGQRRGV